MTIRTPGTGSINDDRDAQREIADQDTGAQMTTRTPGHREHK